MMAGDSVGLWGVLLESKGTTSISDEESIISPMRDLVKVFSLFASSTSFQRVLLISKRC